MTALLLTATVAPGADTPKHTQFDPAERLRQYQEALRFYLTAEGPAWTILFAENSGYPLDTLEAIAAAHARPDRPVHFLGYRSEIPSAWGKGRGEVDLIEKALAHFGDILGDHDPVWKITGRLRVGNIGRMVATQPRDFLVYADFRDVPLVGEMLGGNRWTDTRLIAFTPEGYRTYIARDWPSRSFCVEKKLFRALRPHLDRDPRIVPRFRIQPHFIGASGGSGRSYGSALGRAKTGMRAAMRALAPGLWL
jgi:hypothetical protein